MAVARTRRPSRRRRVVGGSRGTDGNGIGAATSIDDEDDELLDEEHGNINELAREEALREAPSAPHEDRQQQTPAERLRDVGRRASDYEREYRLKLVHRLLMRNIPLDEIARELECSVWTIMRDRKELYKRLREAAKKLDINLLIGDTLAYYTEIGASSLRIATSAKTPTNMRLAALRTALSSRNDMGRFLNTAGVFDVMKYVPESESATEDLGKAAKGLRELQGLLAGLSDEEGLPPAVKQIPESEIFKIDDEDDEEQEIYL